MRTSRSLLLLLGLAACENTGAGDPRGDADDTGSAGDTAADSAADTDTAAQTDTVVDTDTDTGSSAGSDTGRGPTAGAAAFIGDPDGGVIIDATGSANGVTGASYLRHLTITGASEHGVYADTDVRIHDCVIEGNGTGEVDGGGIWVNATVVLMDSMVQGNVSADPSFLAFTPGVAWTAQDLRLTSGSPGSDALDGQDRDGSPQDVGAYGGFLGRFPSGQRGNW